MSRKALISIIGDTHIEIGGAKWSVAEELGEKLTTAEYRIVTGGLGDLPKAIANGARKSSKYLDGVLIAILPSFDPSSVEDVADIAIATGFDEGRNLIVANSDAVIAIGGGAGTLSEIAFAWSLKRLIIAFDLSGWSKLLAGKRVDERIRYPEIFEDKIYKVTTVDETMNVLKQYLPRYNKRHSHIQVRENRDQ